MPENPLANCDTGILQLPRKIEQWGAGPASECLLKNKTITQNSMLYSSRPYKFTNMQEHNIKLSGSNVSVNVIKPLAQEKA